MAQVDTDLIDQAATQVYYFDNIIHISIFYIFHVVVYCTLKRVMWYFEDGGVVYYQVFVVFSVKR